MSDNKVQAIKALNKAQQEMGKALKNATNPHFRSSYADLQSVVEAAMPAFLANGFAVTQPNGADELGDYVETILMHNSGFSFNTSLKIPILALSINTESLPVFGSNMASI